MSKIIGNPVGTTLPKSDWNQTDPTKGDYIKNKPEVVDASVGNILAIKTIDNDGHITEFESFDIQEQLDTIEGKISEEIGDLKWSDWGEKTETSVLCDGSYLFEDADGLGVFGFSVNDENITIENGGNTYVVTIDGTTYTVIGEYSTETEPPSDGMFSEDGQFTLMVSDGSLSLIDFSATEPTTKSVKIVKFKTEVTKVPNKYLDILETVGSDTLTWDGNTDGLEIFDMGEEGVMYKISDTTPTLSEAQRGGSLVTADATYDFTSEDIMTVSDVVYAIISPSYLMVVLEDNADLFGVTISKKGCYSMSTLGISLTINGYNGFTKEVIKEECLPSAAVTKSDMEAYIEEAILGGAW